MTKVTRIEQKNMKEEEVSVVDSMEDREILLKILKDKGVVRVSAFIEGDDLVKISSEFEKFTESEKIDFGSFLPYEKGKGIRVNANDLPDSLIRKFFFDNRFIELCKLYWPNHNECYSINSGFIIRNVAGEKFTAQSLHFDVQRTLKFFLYLKDTNEKNAAFQCVPGSHKEKVKKLRSRHKENITYENRDLTRVPELVNKAISVNGKAGDLIIFDTDVLHRAGECSVGERWVIRAQTEKYDFKYKKGFFTNFFKK